jgi:hypothetical protein
LFLCASLKDELLFEYHLQTRRLSCRRG